MVKVMEECWGVWELERMGGCESCILRLDVGCYVLRLFLGVGIWCSGGVCVWVDV